MCNFETEKSMIYSAKPLFILYFESREYEKILYSEYCFLYVIGTEL